MSNLLPTHFPKYIQALDSVLSEIMAETFAFNGLVSQNHFYTPTLFNKDYIASTFDLDISFLENSKALEYLSEPMTKKRNLGTKKAVQNALNIYGNAQIQTQKEDIRLKPFEFSLIFTIGKDGFDSSVLANARTLVSDVKPLRDSLKGIDVRIPHTNTPIIINSAIQWKI
ncbi:hypothetical protein BKH41_03810 [Helicobacter sp. 12S02232-10]|uniref:phage tail protein n=1 Tax=Helicobacter sp. 12S02232-10 TaxID=1476197 RepID=UPI000BA65749|nr:phage tail protein [Helicobacter sp. 12S02232-10]PAF49216.1 hypothetical protein BKH41_03810 [Helicobacter sp. 12S02232-10]